MCSKNNGNERLWEPLQSRYLDSTCALPLHLLHCDKPESSAGDEETSLMNTSLKFLNEYPEINITASLLWHPSKHILHILQMPVHKNEQLRLYSFSSIQTDARERQEEAH